MIKYLKALTTLLFPNLCIACALHEPVYDGLLCYRCSEEIPKFADLRNNRKLLEQRFPLIYGNNVSFYGLYLFTKASGVQNILYQIKYNGKKHIAIQLGRQLGELISNDYDALIPVPTHYKKLRKRGYNQAEMIAKGINEKTSIPIFTNILEKIINTESQTKKDRVARHTNVQKAYKLKMNPKEDIHKILLIDDVVTTGATLDVCADLLKMNKNVHVDFAFIAMSVT